MRTISLDPFGIKLESPVVADGKWISVDHISDKMCVYEMDMVPKPHPEFDRYLAVLHSEKGIVKLTASSNIINNDRYGDKLRSLFGSVSAALSKKYGPPEEAHDFLRDGSIWDEPRDWTRSLEQEERYLTNFWKFDERKKDGIYTISLGCCGLSDDSSYLRVVYETHSFYEEMESVEQSIDDVF